MCGSSSWPRTSDHQIIEDNIFSSRPFVIMLYWNDNNKNSLRCRIGFDHDVQICKGNIISECTKLNSLDFRFKRNLMVSKKSFFHL